MTSFVQNTFRVTCSDRACDIGGQRKQQDNGLSIICTGPDGRKLTVVGVFDGHGSARGEMFSQLCVDIVRTCVSDTNFTQTFLANPEASGRHICSAITEACLNANKDELDRLGLQYTVEEGIIHTDFLSRISGGSTGTLVFVTESGTVHAFNVGDSDAWFISGNEAYALCKDHSPTSESEYERIHAKWPSTKLDYHYQVACNCRRNPDGSHVFPKRDDFAGYYMKNVNGDMASIMSVGASQLAMTRSFGDEPLRHGGLISEPDYTCIQATESGIVRIASDGFWDNIKNSEIAVRTNESLQEHGYNANALNTAWLHQTHELAQQNFGRGRDNMWGYTITIEKIE